MAIHLLLAVRPQMLQSIILHAFERCPDFEVTCAPADGEHWIEGAYRLSPDAVITTAEASERLGEFFARNPLTKIIAIKQDGRNAFLLELAPNRVPLGQLSPDTMIATIRDAVMKPIDMGVNG